MVTVGRAILSVTIAVIAAGCVAAIAPQPTPVPTPVVSYSAGQVAECKLAEGVLVSDVYLLYRPSVLGTTDAKTLRPEILDSINRFLNAAQFMKAPSVAKAEWVSLLSAMKTAQAIYKKPTTPAQYDAAYQALDPAINAFDIVCYDVVQWGADNLPQ